MIVAIILVSVALMLVLMLSFLLYSALGDHLDGKKGERVLLPENDGQRLMNSIEFSELEANIYNPILVRHDEGIRDDIS